MTNPISEPMLRRQAWKYYFVLFAWPAYLFLLPYAFAQLGWWSLGLVIFPGVYLFTWMGYLMHESWHKYVPNVPNGFFYNVFSWMLITDPQIYGLLHGHHHAEVNTWDDREFHPLGEIHSAGWRRGYHFLEVFTGIVFIVVLSAVMLPRLERYQAKYRVSSAILAVLMWVVILGGLGLGSARAFELRAAPVLMAYGVLLIACSLVLHHSQMVEHGNLIVPGDWKQRNLKTRNLRRQTCLEKAFSFMTHGDAREHVLHHTQVQVHSRPFPGLTPLPEGSVIISLKQYMGILGDMLAGKNSEF